MLQVLYELPAKGWTAWALLHMAVQCFASGSAKGTSCKTTKAPDNDLRMAFHSFTLLAPWDRELQADGEDVSGWHLFAAI